MSFLALPSFAHGLLVVGVLNVGAGPGRAGSVVAEGRLVYERTCALCHGSAGKGNGPASVALNVKPMDFTDSRRMADVTSERRVKAVKQGGASVGASPTMPSFRAALTPAQIEAVLTYISTRLVNAGEVAKR